MLRSGPLIACPAVRVKGVWRLDPSRSVSRMNRRVPGARQPRSGLLESTNMPYASQHLLDLARRLQGVDSYGALMAVATEGMRAHTRYRDAWLTLYDR